MKREVEREQLKPIRRQAKKLEVWGMAKVYESSWEGWKLDATVDSAQLADAGAPCVSWALLLVAVREGTTTLNQRREQKLEHLQAFWVSLSNNFSLLLVLTTPSKKSVYQTSNYFALQPLIFTTHQKSASLISLTLPNWALGPIWYCFAFYKNQFFFL